jgi:hypothetical protein
MNFWNKIAFLFGYTPMVQAPAPVSSAKPAPQIANKPAPRTAMAVNEQVRSTLTMAKDFYHERGNRIVAVDLQCHLDAFEDSLLLSATDGCSVETAKLLGQIG